jgi:lipoprotein-anchoring transpeptidase ErfK/SrfK
MMRKYFAAALAVTVLFAFAPHNASAAPSKEEAALILKKKKLAAEIKVLEAKKAELTVKAKPVVKIKTKTVKVITQPITTPAVAHAQPCKSFFKCLFGNKRRSANVQNASFVGSANPVLSNQTSHENVTWTETKYPVGSLIVRTPERALYYVSGKGEAIRYSVGVGREGMQWSGQSSIVSKAEWPAWNPPAEMIKREALKGHMLPDHMEGGPGNPLGARAMYIGGRIYRVHGTNNEASIGGAVSSGCIRMMNADVIDLYDRVKIGAKIYVYQ